MKRWMKWIEESKARRDLIAKVIGNSDSIKANNKQSLSLRKDCLLRNEEEKKPDYSFDNWLAKSSKVSDEIEKDKVKALDKEKELSKAKQNKSKDDSKKGDSKKSKDGPGGKAYRWTYGSEQEKKHSDSSEDSDTIQSDTDGEASD